MMFYIILSITIYAIVCAGLSAILGYKGDDFDIGVALYVLGWPLVLMLLIVGSPFIAIHALGEYTGKRVRAKRQKRRIILRNIMYVAEKLDLTDNEEDDEDV